MSGLKTITVMSTLVPNNELQTLCTMLVCEHNLNECTVPDSLHKMAKIKLNTCKVTFYDIKYLLGILLDLIFIFA